MFKLLRFVAALVGLLGLISTAVVALVPGNRTPPSVWIVFTSTRDGDNDIYRVGMDGSSLQALTVNTAFDSWPVFSPDGQWIAFVSNRDGTKEIYKMRADGSDQVQLTSGPGDKELPQWSPDGEWIAYTAHWGGTEIYRMRADGTGQQVLTDNSNYDGIPIWSPDGEWIIYVSYQDGNEEIYRMRPGGSQQQRLTHDPSYDESPALSPDGQWIVYESENNNEIFLMRADGRDKKNLTQSPGWSDYGPTWSPDGKWIIFVSVRGNNTDIYRMRPDGSQQQRLTTNPGYDHSLAISPDGQWVVYDALYQSSMQTICRMRVDGTEQRCFMIQDAYLPQWSPPLKRSWHSWRLIAGWGALIGVAIGGPTFLRRRTGRASPAPTVHLPHDQDKQAGLPGQMPTKTIQVIIGGTISKNYFGHAGVFRARFIYCITHRTGGGLCCFDRAAPGAQKRTAGRENTAALAAADSDRGGGGRLCLPAAR